MSIARAREIVKELEDLDRAGRVFTIKEIEAIVDLGDRYEATLKCIRAAAKSASLALLDHDLALVHEELSAIATACGGRLGEWKGIKSR